MKAYISVFKRFIAISLATTLVFTTAFGLQPAAQAAEALLGENGTNQQNMEAVISTGLLNNIGTPTDSWQEYLGEQWNLARTGFGWKDTSDIIDPDWIWDGTMPGIDAPQGTDEECAADPNLMPTKIGSVWTVYSGQQLHYALRYAVTDDTIQIRRDIDLAGYEYNWSLAGSGQYTRLTLDGEKEGGGSSVIYNLGCLNTWFIYSMTSGIITNLIFDSAKIVTNNKNYTGIFGDITGTSLANPTVVKNVEVCNSLFFNGYKTTGGIGNESYLSPLGHTSRIEATDYYTRNNVLYGGDGIHVGGAFARADDAVIKSSFSVDSTIIVAGKHSGGFISCSDGTAEYVPTGEGLLVEDCFTNNTVYGNESTGVFIGSINLWDTVTLRNCYTSGSIEGKNALGGFIGLVEDTFNTNQTLTVEDCYSTSIVGMRSGGTNLGGFVGRINGNGLKANFLNCYAAGEVGSIDTDVTTTRTQFKDVGGFTGSVQNSIVSYESCYYDKQTTAMREWETGMTRDIAPNYIDAGLGDEAGLNNIVGLRGVLTSDSLKSGSGLASHPSPAQGFTGFSNTTFAPDSQLPSDSTWVFDGGSVSVDVQHNCMYPQLTGFYDASAGEWGDHTDMVKAFSYASVATVHQQVWDRCLNPDHTSLSTSVYDTVRDLTQRFSMTSYITAPAGTGDVSISWSHDKARVNLYGKSRPVIGYFEQFYLDRYQRSYQIADQFAPGIAWFTVKTNVNGVEGTRRLRIIPTANIEPGVDQTIRAGSTYDHALDVAFAYSTGPRMSRDSRDITQGVYPSEPLTAEQQNLLSRLYEKQGDNSYLPVGNSAPVSFGTDAKGFTGLSMEYMAGETNPGHPNNYLNLYLYKSTVVYDAASGLNRLAYDSADRIELTPDNDWGKKLNGEKAFEDEDFGRYVLEYNWVLPDARFIRASAMLLINPQNNTVTTEVLDKDSGLAVDSVMRQDIRSYTKQADGSFPSPDFSSGTLVGLSEEVPSGSPVLVAQQKDELSGHRIVDIFFEITTIDSVQSMKFEDVQMGSQVVFPVRYYYDSQGINSDYFVKSVTVNKTYTLEYDFVNNYYFVRMDGEYQPNSSIHVTDLEDNVKLTVYVQNPAEFTLKATADMGGTISPAGNKTVSSGATQAYTAAPEAGYELKDVQIDGVSIGPVSTYTFSNINADHTIHATFRPKTTVDTYTITALYDTNGTVTDGVNPANSSPLVVTDIPEGSDRSFTITPKPGYLIGSVQVDGIPQPIPADGIYAFTNINANHVLKVNFVPVASTAGSYIITALAETGGTINGKTSLAETVASGLNSSELVITSLPGYRLKELLVDGFVLPIPENNSYQFINVRQNHMLVARFEHEDKSDGTDPVPPDPDGIYHTLRYLAETGGSISGAATQQVADGKNGTEVTAVPSTGYSFAGWSDGVSAATRQELNVLADLTVTALFRSNEGILNTYEHFGYLIGYPDGLIGPLDNITRAEVATIFFRLLKDNVRASAWQTNNPFPDVNRQDWFNNAVSTAYALNIVRGRDGGLFCPGAPITRAEFASIAARFDSREYSGVNLFSDIDGHWAANDINRAAVKGWVIGDGSGAFRPDDLMTRAEAVTLINRVLERDTATEDKRLPGTIIWPDNLSTEWYYLAMQEATNSHSSSKHGGVESWLTIRPIKDWKTLETEWATAQ